MIHRDSLIAMGSRDLCALFLLGLAFSVASGAGADEQTLNCINNQELQADGIFWSCQNFGQVLARENTTFYLTVDAASATYQQFDINITLTSLVGDADLIVATPGATTNLASTHNVGQDIVFVYRTELEAGQYRVMVLGYALDTQYELTVELVEAQRELRPAAALALGQMMVDCCAMDDTACLTLKEEFPELQSTDPDMNPDFCAMHGNVCTRNGYLLELGAFAGGDLACVFPAESIMETFTRLRRIDLSGNRIAGNITVIAQTLSKLPALEYLDLGYNGLLGPLDTACGLAATKELESLDFTNNALSGSIPPCLTELPEMVEMHLDYNALTGTIPAFPKDHSPLVYFTASYQLGFASGLTGEVPSTMSRMQQLGYLDISGNMLTGMLPGVTSNQMINLRLAENFLTGTIPASYGLMENLVSLELEDNQIEGTLPPALANMPSLKLLDVSSNTLSGTLPADWSGASNLIMLILTNNTFSGVLPASLANVESMVVLDASDNQLAGTLSDFAFQTAANRADLHSALRYFDVSNNSLAGDLTQATGLNKLAVFSNTAPDEVPLSEMMLLAANTTTSQIKLRASMTPRTFDISYNGFTGQFPKWLVKSLVDCKEDITVILDGDQLICPPGGFELGSQAQASRLDGLMCYSASASELITASTPMANITSLITYDREGLSGGAIAGIVILVLVLVAALAGVGVWLYKKRQQGNMRPGMFQPFDKYDSGMAAGITTSAPSSTFGASSKFGGGRMVYQDMDEVEMGSAARAQSPKAFQSVNLKSGRKLDLP